MNYFNIKLYLLFYLSLFIITNCSKDNPDSLNETLSTQLMKYSVSISSSEGGSVNVQSGTYNAGTILNLTATPNDGYEFVGWTGSNESSSELIITVNSNLEIVANFQLIQISFNPDCPGLFYSSRPNPVGSDDTHNYYIYEWQSDPKICINIYDASILGGRDQKVTASLDWVKLNLPNIIPINVFYTDQFNASQEAKTSFDTDFCTLIREGNEEISSCILESAGNWGDRSYGAGVYNTYLHNGADLVIYDDMFPSPGSDETEDSGLIYLMHEYFHTFQTSHFFFFEEKNQFGINKNNFETGKKLPFLPIWMGEGSADFASLPLMAKQNLNFNHYERAIQFLNQARASLDADPSISLEDFETENTRVGDEYYAYGGGFMAFVYLWHLSNDNFKKIMNDYYIIFAEKEKLNPGQGWKDAFEETFGITVSDFYTEFDTFMLQDRDSQIAIIKSSEIWKNASWD